jgi:hypothetical protein
MVLASALLTVSKVDAQACAPYAIDSSVPSGACLETCCSAHDTCFNAALMCSVATDYPESSTTQCTICDTELMLCYGQCGFDGVLPDSSETPCMPDCEGDSVMCGMPDGCGGKCTDEDVCGLLARRPEFMVVLL